MIKTFLFASFLFLFSFGFSFDNLPKTYLIKVGRENAETQIIEYFSLECPLCLKVIRNEFKEIFFQCIQKKDISWTFHPDPIDMTTLRFMICLEGMEEKNRFPFFWEVIQAIHPKAYDRNALILSTLNERYGGKKLPLSDLDFISESQAKQAGFSYLSQEDIPKILPSISKNGKMLNIHPDLKAIKEAL